MLTDTKYKKYKSIIGNPKIHNSWRAIRFTDKGKKIGHCPSWQTYENFYNDMAHSYIDGHVLNRIDKDSWFCKDNCVWVNRSDIQRRSKCNLEYLGKTQSLIDWCIEYKLNYNGVRQRYHRGKNYTVEEILFGKLRRERTKTSEMSLITRASKLVSQYKLKDKKRGYSSDFDYQWFAANILDKECTYCGSVNKIGADRIDNHAGHTKHNILPCCYRCNTVKNNFFTYDEMCKIGSFLRDNIDKKKDS